MWTLLFAITNGRSGYAFAAHATLERFLRTLGSRRLHHIVRSQMSRICQRTFLVGRVITIRSTVAHKVPAYANAGRSTLERSGRTSRPGGRAG